MTQREIGEGEGKGEQYLVGAKTHEVKVLHFVLAVLLNPLVKVTLGEDLTDIFHDECASGKRQGSL